MSSQTIIDDIKEQGVEGVARYLSTLSLTAFMLLVACNLLVLHTNVKYVLETSSILVACCLWGLLCSSVLRYRAMVSRNRPEWKVGNVVRIVRAIMMVIGLIWGMVGLGYFTASIWSAIKFKLVVLLPVISVLGFSVLAQIISQCN
jgi:hypothetical protein